jgi:hypothetical protein
MKKFLPAVLMIVVLVAACVPSVNPFYTDKDVVTDSRLPGKWVEDKGSDSHVVWTFDTATNNAYAVLLQENKDKSGKFDAHLFKLGAGLFLDLTPTDCEYATNQADIVGVAMIPGHLLVRLTFDDQKLNLAFCDPDWTKKYLKKNPTAIGHRVLNDGVILTADTPALQKFVTKHLGKDELFSEGADYRRQP